MTHKKLTQTERERIAVWLKEKVTKKEIARRLGRDIKTIRRELARNSIKVAVGKGFETIYEPVHAQSVAIKRRQYAYAAKQPLKDKNIYSYVLKHLREGWSPEQISGRLRQRDHKGGKRLANLYGNDLPICL